MMWRYKSVLAIIVLASAQFAFVTAEKGVLFSKDSSDSNWTWLSRYTLSAGAGWRRESSTHEYTTCDLQQTRTNSTNSWLISNFIPVKPANFVTLHITFTARQCPSSLPFCKHHINIYNYQSDEVLPGGVTKDDIEKGKLAFVGNATAFKLWTSGQPHPVNNAVLNISVSRRGVYIGFQDTGACLAMRQIQLTYTYCGRAVIGGAVFNSTESSPGSVVQVHGECLEMFERLNPLQPPIARCLSDGTWNTSDTFLCRCRAGYYIKHSACTVCPDGTYKPRPGNTGCLGCSGNTESAAARDTCVCKAGYYRAPGDPSHSRCSEPPSAPREPLTVLVQPTSILLSWKPPLNDGGRNDVTYNITCRICLQGNRNSCKEPCSDTIEYTPTANHSPYTHVTISNLSPGFLYKFRISALNGVSAIAGESAVQFVDANVSIPTQEVHHQDASLRISYFDKNMAVISLPVPPYTIHSVACNLCNPGNKDCVTKCNGGCGHALQITKPSEKSFVVVSRMESATIYKFTFNMSRSKESRGSNITSVCLVTLGENDGGSVAEVGKDSGCKALISRFSTLALGVAGGMLFCSIVMVAITVHLRRRWYKAAAAASGGRTDHSSSHAHEIGQYDMFCMEETFFNIKDRTQNGKHVNNS